jgi:hypothetical protein
MTGLACYAIIATRSHLRGSFRNVPLTRREQIGVSGIGEEGGTEAMPYC